MRPATLWDLDPICEALLKFYRRNKFQARHADHDEVRGYLKGRIEEGEGLWFIGGILLMVEAGYDWYTRDKFLFEQLVLQVYHDDSASAEDVPPALYQLRDRLGCTTILASDTSGGRMVPVYKKFGFVPLGTQLVREN